MLYIYMSKGYDKVKISFHRFLECLYPIYNLENRFNHNKIAFLIMDIDRDNVLNIVNLLHLQKNLNPKSKIGQDIIKLFEFFIDHFLKKGTGGQTRGK